VALEKDPAGHGKQNASDDRVAPAAITIKKIVISLILQYVAVQ
jgi:hypothetical protein